MVVGRGILLFLLKKRKIKISLFFNKNDAKLVYFSIMVVYIAWKKLGIFLTESIKKGDEKNDERNENKKNE